MEDRSRVWLWVLGAAALIVAVVALVIAMQAKDGNTSDADVAKQVKAEAETQIAGLQKQIQGQVQAGRKAGAAATVALRRIDREQKALSGNQAVSKSDLAKLSGQINALQSDVSNVTAQQNKMSDQVASLDQRVTHLQKQVQRQNSGGTG
jgi:chromosome segregation ATPase